MKPEALSLPSHFHFPPHKFCFEVENGLEAAKKSKSVGKSFEVAKMPESQRPRDVKVVSNHIQVADGLIQTGQN